MNATRNPRFLRCLMLFFLGLGCLPLFAASAAAADMALPILQANLVYEFAADRARMIQISIVIVALGCAMIWWYR